MTELLVRFEMPKHGWMRVEIETESQVFRMSVSHVLSGNVLRSLTLALLGMLQHKGFSTSIAWYTEPETYHFAIESNAGNPKFRIREHLQYEKVKTHFEVEMPSLDLVLAFWRGLRCIQSQILDNEFQEGWYHPFPDTELAKLTEEIRELKRKTKLKRLIDFGSMATM
jgi:hypothetical protein